MDINFVISTSAAGITLCLNTTTGNRPNVPGHDCPLLQVRDLDYSYPDGTVALSGANLSIYRGELMFLVGPNGSGKTTLARHLNGLLSPQGGDVLVDGKTTDGMHRGALAGRVAVCFQNPDHQLFSVTVKEEVGFAPSVLGYAKNRREKLVKRALEITGISDLRDIHPFSLSQGQRRLVAIAATFAQDADAIILDEPTRGLDRNSRKKLAEALVELASAGHAVMVITHDLDWAWEHANTVALMECGKIVSRGGYDVLVSPTARRLRCSPRLAELGRSLGVQSERTPGKLAETIVKKMFSQGRDR